MSELTYTDNRAPAPIRMDGNPLDWPLSERPLIYVAGYFSANPMHGTNNAVRAAERLLDLGWLPMIPHINIIWDMIAEYPHPPSFWYEYDLGVLRRCDAMYVCDDKLTGKSKGVTEEIVFCTRHDIPIFYEMVDAKDRYER